MPTPSVVTHRSLPRRPMRAVLLALVLVGVAAPSAGSTAPNGEPVGEDRWVSYGPGTPQVGAIGADPIDPTTIYAAADSGNGGGIYKTADGGGRWNLTGTDWPPGLEAQAIAVDPTDHNRVFAGTLSDIHRSTDAGQTWQRIGKGFDGEGSVAFAFDPTRPGIMYASACHGSVQCLSAKGVYKSEDGGNSWRPVNQGITPGSLIYALAVNPADPLTVYAGSGDGRVYKTVDGGDSWAEVFRTDTVVGLAIDSSQPDVVVAATRYTGVFRSTDGGTTWIRPEQDVTNTAMTGLAADPSSPGTMYTSSFVDFDFSDTFDTIFKTTDGGNTWIPLGKVGDNAWSVTVSPSGVPYAATAEGVFRSLDGGLVWKVVDAGLPGAYVGEVAVQPGDPETVYAPCCGGLGVSRDGGWTWDTVTEGLTGGSVTAIEIDPSSPSTLYGAVTDKVFKSTDRGRSWFLASDDLPPYPPGVSRIVVAPSLSSRLYASAGDGVYRSDDGARSWRPAMEGLPEENPRTLTVSPVDASLVYAATNDGLFRTRDGGRSWEVVTGGLPEGTSFWSMVFDPFDHEQLLAASYSADVYRSADGGRSWHRSSGGLTRAYTTIVVADPTRVGTFYVGSEYNGVFRSIDGGRTWSPFSEGLMQLNVRDLAFDARGTVLYAATSGGGVYRRALVG